MKIKVASPRHPKSSSHTWRGSVFFRRPWKHSQEMFRGSSTFSKGVWMSRAGLLTEWKIRVPPGMPPGGLEDGSILAQQIWPCEKPNVGEYSSPMQHLWMHSCNFGCIDFKLGLCSITEDLPCFHVFSLKHAYIVLMYANLPERCFWFVCTKCEEWKNIMPARPSQPLLCLLNIRDSKKQQVTIL